MWNGRFTENDSEAISFPNPITFTGAVVFSSTVNITGVSQTGQPASNDAAALGASGTAWSDLFIASGGVINFNAGDVTLTHSSNTLTLAGGTLTLTYATPITISGTLTKGINFAGSTPAFSDADDAFIAIGTWNDAIDISSQTEHFAAIQVHLDSNTSVAKDIAAARFRVDTDVANTLTAVGCLQLRQNIGHDVASSAIINASVNVSGACAVQTGSLLGGYFSIEGSGAVTKAGDNDCTPLVAVNNNTGGGIDNVFVAMQNGTGTTVTEIINVVCEHGTATSGISIEKTANGTAMTNAINITGTITTAINFAGVTGLTNFIKFDSVAGAVVANALVPAAAPDAGTMGADAAIKVLIGSDAYYIPMYNTLHA